MVEEVKETGEQKGKDLDSSAPKEKVHDQANISSLVSPTDSRFKGEERVEEKISQEAKEKEDDSSKAAEGEKMPTEKATDDSGKAVEGEKILSPTRDTAEAVKEFLTKEMMEFDEPELLQGPFNFDSLSPVQTMKLTSFTQAKAKEKILKSHMEDCELIEIASGVLEKIMPSF